jgi:hypothetical protein
MWAAERSVTTEDRNLGDPKKVKNKGGGPPRQALLPDECGALVVTGKLCRLGQL